MEKQQLWRTFLCQRYAWLEFCLTTVLARLQSAAAHLKINDCRREHQPQPHELKILEAAHKIERLSAGRRARSRAAGCQPSQQLLRHGFAVEIQE